MPAKRASPQDEPQRRGKPATTPEAIENQIVLKAYELAEKQIEDGTASAQILTHFLKMGSSREKLEKARLGMEVEFMEAKKRDLESQARVEEMYKEALGAMRSYQGAEPLEMPDDPDY